MEPFGVSFFHIFLHAKKDMAPGGPEKSSAVGENEKQKDHAVGDRRKSREACKTVKSKTPPLEVVGQVARLVNT